MSKERVTGLLIAVLFLHAGVSRAMTPAVCRVDDTPQANAPAKVVHRTVTDPATGLEIRLEQTARGQMTVDVADKTISIHKDLQGSRAVTTLTAGRNRLAISFDGRNLSVTGPKGTQQSSLATQETLTPVLKTLQGSSLVRTAKELLDRLALQGDSAEGNALLLTRALFGSVTGEMSSVVQYQEWTRHMLARPKVVRVVLAQGPGECWDSYSKEAIRIFDDYADCWLNCKWYQPFCEGACEAIYVLRSEMAFMWYFNCNGPFYGG